MSSPRSMLVRDRFDRYVFLFENDFAMRWFQDKNDNIELFSLL
jgi:peptide chain release factor 3